MPCYLNAWPILLPALGAGLVIGCILGIKIEYRRWRGPRRVR